MTARTNGTATRTAERNATPVFSSATLQIFGQLLSQVTINYPHGSPEFAESVAQIEAAKAELAAALNA